MESATFNSIVQDATHTRAVSLAAIPLFTDVEILMTLYLLEVCINNKHYHWT